MNFNWANQFAKNALRSAQKRIDSVLDITPEEDEEDEDDDDEEEGGRRQDKGQDKDEEGEQEGQGTERIKNKSETILVASNSNCKSERLKTEDIKDIDDGEGDNVIKQWDHKHPPGPSQFPQPLQKREEEELSKNLEEQITDSDNSEQSHQWDSQWNEQQQQSMSVVDSEPNPIRDSHHPGSYQHSPSSNSPDEACVGSDEHEHEITESNEDDEAKNTISIITPHQEAIVVVVEEGRGGGGEGDERKCSEGGNNEEEIFSSSTSQSHTNQHHDDALTNASSDIEILRQVDTWSLMSLPSSMPAESNIPLEVVHTSESISLEPLSQQSVTSMILSGNDERTHQLEVEVARLKSQIQHQERRIGDLLCQNQKLEKKSHDLIALKAARNKQTSTEAKLMKKLADKETELNSLLQEGEKLAETNGKLTKELKKLRANFVEQEQLAKKGAQAEIDRDLANEQLRGLNTENAKLRATIKTLETDSAKLKAADEILVNDLRRRDERIEKMSDELESAKTAKVEADEEVKRLQSLIEQISTEANQREISNKGIEEITKGLNAAINEERLKNERQASYIESLEKRLAEMMDTHRDAAQMIAMANSPLLESIRQLEADAKSKAIAYESSMNEKDVTINALTTAKFELVEKNKEMIAELNKLKSASDETSVVIVEINRKLDDSEYENRRLKDSLERNEHIIESLRVSLRGKEDEIDKLYVRLRDEAESAERQALEKQQKIDKLEVECGELSRELSTLCERQRNISGSQLSNERKYSDNKRMVSSLSMIMNTPGNETSSSVPYISTIAAQSELSEVMMKYEQSMRRISSLQSQLDSMMEDSKMLITLRKQYQDLNMRYESLLEAHGEKIERIEELEMDLADVKKLFRDQMELLLGKN